VLAYRHLFHAGNAADVFKHALLARLMLALGKKEKPFFYLDTHAGTGRYDLSHPWARKNLEFENGIERILQRSDLPMALKPYLQTVRTENANGKLRWYPGSPRIALRFMRPGDRICAGRQCTSSSSR
jgi:23S rRNA (adenine2030-N6)-methyltransferase